MKTKNKILESVGIAIVLCSLFLVALPTIAAEQTAQEVSASASEVTTASEDDYVLDIYGNANEDDTIDMRDLTYVKLIFFGKKPETELADAKYDGKINPLDFIQIKLIIVGKEKELTLIDSTSSATYPDGRIVTVHKPVERIIALSCVEELRTLNAKDKIVGISEYTADEVEFFPEISKLPTVGSGFYPDVEKIFSLSPDLVVTVGSQYTSWTAGLEEKLAGTDVVLVRMDFYKPHNMAEEIRKLGYIVDRREESDEFTYWHDGYMNTIYERVADLTDDEKPRVYNEAGTYSTYTKYSGWTMPGGINIAADISESEYTSVDAEWVIDQNPDIIVKQVWGVTGYTVDDPAGVRAIRDEIMNRPELSGVRAVTEGKVYCMDMGTSCSVVGHAYLATWFQPELFEDLDPKAIHQEYLTRFQGLDYDLDKHGVFVYPLPAS